jgi:dinuclear metal center YbgI/SA1388 family protein
MSAKLRDIVSYLDAELRTSAFRDRSANGLQVEGAADVRTVGLGVDACLATFRAAKEHACDLVVVHHGMIWNDGIRSVKGNTRKRLDFLLRNDISLYAAHLPLDAHPKLGNNVGLAKLLGIRKPVPFGEYRGQTIGFAGKLPRPVSAKDLAAALGEKLGRKLGASPFVRGDAKRKLKSVAICSGGGMALLAEAAEAGYDALVTGEGVHADSLEIADLGFTVVFAGHYETETLGVKAVGAALKRRFGLRTVFLDAAHQAPAR